MKHNRIKRLFLKLSDMSISRKLLITYFVLVIMPLSIFTVYAFLRINRVIQEQTFTAAQKTFEESCDGMEELFQNSENVLESLVMDSLVYQMASKAPGEEDAVSQMENTYRLSEDVYKRQLQWHPDRSQPHPVNLRR